MAEALISVLLEQLASVAYVHVGQEVKLVLNAKKDVEAFAANLELIRTMLEDAEQRQMEEPGVRNWLEKLKDVSYEMDNVLDEWKTKILKQEVEKEEEHGRSTSLVNKKKKKAVCFSIPSSCFCFGQVPQIITLDDIAFKIKFLNENLDEISRQGKTYNFLFTERMISDSEQPEQEKTSSFVDKSIIFGREQEKEVLVRKLLNESSQEESGLLVIPIVGMAGMGKTTLAQLAFNDEDVNACFDLKIWVCVSKPFDEIKTAKAIIIGAKGVIPNSNTSQDLFQCMSESIKGKKLLLVLDDVWTEDQGKWEKLMFPLIQSGAACVSRILVTTQKQEVADMMGARTHTIYLERLSEENCLSIFNRMAFFNRKKDRELEAIGEKIARKCKGLPLAIKTLGNFMRYKEKRKEWHEVLNNKIWELEEVAQQVFQPLLQSYFDLAPTVKRCLLYCAIFPKGHLIDKDYLIELWMSQDYLYSKGNIEKIIEKIIGQRIFDNLVMRSFFQDFEEDNKGNIRRCKMHDIMHDFLRFLTQNECFTMEGNDTMEPLGDKIRHLTLVLAPKVTLSCVSFSNCYLRTLATFDSKFNVVDSSLISQFKYIRTLNLSGNYIEELPEMTGELVHLRFIDLSNNPLKKLPNTVCNLYNLQTLRLERCVKLESLPQSMGKLINLKHLYVWGCSRLANFPKGIAKLRNLRAIDQYRVGGGKDDHEGFTQKIEKIYDDAFIFIDGELKVAAGEGEKERKSRRKRVKA
ncbi:putative disease resistance protein RGA3 [Pyrus communis]|uniref:putative disease resistance protein RGA3 n=1 Tax=Pyrus communis TaxID=23211 RepID=UPI0035C2315E